jgi:2-polyprenyl-3-methyl-5-hydroxy-6-metoxy-1,4-benzoquinol methylase
MPISEASPNRGQAVTDRYFARHASYWAEIYKLQGVKEFIHQERLRIVLDLVNELSLPTGAAALEVGCGAGYASTALAEQGYKVDAIDTVQEMVNTARARAKQHKVDDKVRVNIGDVYSLPFSDNKFNVVIAMGVLPWLPFVELPLREMSRALQPGGYLIVTVDNRWALRWLVDPLTNPLIIPGKELIKRVLQGFGHQRPCAPWYPTSKAAFDAVLATTGLEKVSGVTAGFGPFTWLNRELLSFQRGVKLHSRLQRLADQGVALLRSTGCHYIVLARKPGDGPRGAEVTKGWPGSSRVGAGL